MASTSQPSHGDAPALALYDEHTGHRFLVRNPPSDIDACVAFSFMRCILSIFSILLAITDIPRTGLAVDLFAHYPSVAPGTVLHYGPYAYPVVHLNRSDCSNSTGCTVHGYSGNAPVSSVDLWPFKFDTLSIPTRALAEHLNVSAYPRCMLYETPCPTHTIPLDTTFTMTNELVDAIQQRYFRDESKRNVPIMFQTVSFWADRLHHILLGEIGHRIDHRLHSVYRFTTNETQRARGTLALDVCQPRSATDRHRPLFCSLVVEWLCDHPTHGPQTQIPIQEDINLRFAALQQQYPSAQLDLTLILTRSVVQSQNVAFLPTVFYRSDNLEITTIIRGRRCGDAGEKSCAAVFLDDYRYERVVLESSSGEMKMITGVLRAASQLYVWLRVFLLAFICYKSRLAEASHRSKSIPGKMGVVVLTLLKIPSHALVYSSWFPIVGYSLAHYIDCGPVHLISDGFWASANGWFTFDFFSYVVVATVQMRNIWLIALFWKCAITIHTIFFQRRFGSWQPRHGVLAFRGVFIGMVSFLTIFSFLRLLHFRNTKVLRFDEMPRDAGPKTLHIPPQLSTMSDYGYRLDLKTTFIASVLIGSAELLVQSCLRVFTKSTTSFFTCHNYYVPLSAGKMFPVSALNIFWYNQLQPQRTSKTTAASHFASIAPEPHASVSPEPQSVAATSPLPVRATLQPRLCSVCDFTSTPLNWRPTQGCLHHENIFSLGSRSVEVQSMVRLMNIGMLSDPFVFLRLRLFGTRLYLYRARSTGDSMWASRRTPKGGGVGIQSLGEQDAVSMGSVDARLSEAPSFMLSPVLLNEQMRNTALPFQLVTTINSKHVPWTLLVDCG